ncbi:aminotransferase-like mobile domain-containing protein [Tanacetum coccineum]
MNYLTIPSDFKGYSGLLFLSVCIRKCISLQFEVEAEEETEEVFGNEDNDIANGALQVVLADPGVLDCLICHKPLCTPAFQCQNGHLACCLCCSKVDTVCPICYTLGYEYTRCRGLEVAIESIDRILCINKTLAAAYSNKKSSLCCSLDEILNLDRAPGAAPSSKKYVFAACQTISVVELMRSSSNQSVVYHAEMLGLVAKRVSMNNHAHMLHASALTLHAPLMDLSKASTSTLASRTMLTVRFTYDTTFSICIEIDQTTIFLQEQNENVIFIFNHEVQEHGQAFNIDCVSLGCFKSGFVNQLTAKSMETCLSLRSVPEIYTKWSKDTPRKCFNLTVPSVVDYDGILSLSVCIKKKVISSEFEEEMEKVRIDEYISNLDGSLKVMLTNLNMFYCKVVKIARRSTTFKR